MVEKSCDTVSCKKIYLKEEMGFGIFHVELRFK